jgi:hypothetical protein
MPMPDHSHTTIDGPQTAAPHHRAGPATPPATHSPTSTHAGPDPDDLADLTTLAAELDRHGLHAELCTPAGRLPYLHVRNPQASALSERVYAQADSFWFSWAERITGCDEITTAAATLARVLRTTAG